MAENSGDAPDIRALLDQFRADLMDIYGLECEGTIAFFLFLEDLERMRAGRNYDSYVTFFRSQGEITDPGSHYQYIRGVNDLVSRSSANGRNFQLLRNAIVTYIVSLWEHKYRQALANAAGFLNKNDIKSDLFHDLTRYRNSIAHNSGKFDEKTRTLNFFNTGSMINFDIDQIDDLFRKLFSELNRIALDVFDIEINFLLDQKDAAIPVAMRWSKTTGSDLEP